MEKQVMANRLNIVVVDKQRKMAILGTVPARLKRKNVSVSIMKLNEMHT